MSCSSLGSGTVTWTPRELHEFPKLPDLKLSRKLGVDRSWWRHKNYSHTTLFLFHFHFHFHFPSSRQEMHLKKKSSNFCTKVHKFVPCPTPFLLTFTFFSTLTVLAVWYKYVQQTSLFIGLASTTKGKDFVFRFILEYSSLRDFFL